LAADDLELAIAQRVAMIDIIEGDVAHGLAVMGRIAEEAREAGMHEVGVTAFRDAALHALRAFDYDEARRYVAEGLVYADSIQQSHCYHTMAALGAELAWAEGRWDEAMTRAEQAAVDPGCAKAPAMARQTIGAVAFGRGDVDRAQAAFAASLGFGDRSEQMEFRLLPRWGMAETALAAGEPAVAVRWCEDALDLARTSGERATFVPLVVTGTRAYQAASRPDEAARWVQTCEAFLERTPAFGAAALHHARGLVALSANATGAARTELEAAVAGWDASGRLWEASLARLDLATAMARSNRFATAVALAGQVREVAGRVGSPVLAARADELIRQGRGRIVEDDPWRPLTAREFAVARLIAEGRTNAEIADQLGIAPKTASSHVEHILAKLGASRRAEIAVWASSIERSTPAAR
jgi:DNA-binding CsgD family transcriptional regulator